MLDPGRAGEVRNVLRSLAPVALVVALPLLATIGPTGDVAEAEETCAGTLCAGAASIDMTWNVGAGPGQLGTAGHGVLANEYDPHLHAWKMEPSDGVQSRLDAKAVVLQGPEGDKIAYVKTDVYLQQDLLTRRVVELVTGADPAYTVEGLTAESIMLGGTHNHSAPHYTSTAWGVWIFADVLDLRAFDATARSIAEAIHAADGELRPATVGASAIRYDGIQQNILGPATADDGTPAGFPRDHFDDELAVVRIDDAVTDEPIAAIVNLALHPESIGGGADLISADFTGVVEREVERALGRQPGSTDGPVVAWAQSGLGDVEPDSSRANPPEDRQEYWRRDFAQAERMAAELSTAVLDTWHDVKAPDGAHPDRMTDRHVPPSADAAVDAIAYRFPGPPTHPTPTVSNCRTDHLGVPVLGFPDCQRAFETPEEYQELVETLRASGFPIPDNVGSTPSYTAVHESLTLHLQVLRVGEILLAACPCEAVSDMSLNLKSRTDTVADNVHLGYEWPCEEGDDGTIRCGFGRHAWQALEWREVDRDAYERMRAQVRNDAAGWERDVEDLGGEAEPTDPAAIKGNFTHDELGTDDGFAMPLMVGTANDYVGYVVTYREYQRGDHYRKALTPFGPRTADHINNRLVEMARELRGGPSPQDARELAHETVDDLIQQGKVIVFGAGAEGFSSVYEAAIPDDGGDPGAVVAQPDPAIERFDAATFTWEGGSNYTDRPGVVVQRLLEEDGPTWRTVAEQAGGEIVVTLAYRGWQPEAVLDHVSGDLVHEWTATFEVYDAVPPGTYRFVVHGAHREDGDARPYEVVSEPFEVDVWRGIAVEELAIDGDRATFSVRGVEAVHDEGAIPGPVALPAPHVRYPFTHDRGLPFIEHEVEPVADSSGEPFWRYCFRCTFRPWAPHGEIVDAELTVERTDGTTEVRDATYEPGADRWVVDGLSLEAGDAVRVEPGQVRDEQGNTNGEEAVAP
jgi:hypothetical protein